MSRIAAVLCFFTLSCGAARDPREAQVVVRWVDGDVTIANVTPDGTFEDWRTIGGSNRDGGLARYGVALDGRYICTVGTSGLLMVRSTTSTLTFQISENLGEFNPDGCILDRRSNILTYQRDISRIRTFALDSNLVIPIGDFVFDNGALGGPATVRGSSELDLAVVSSPFGRMEIWAGGSDGWHQGDVFVQPGRLHDVPPGVGSRTIVVALAQHPEIIVLQLSTDGSIESTTAVETPRSVGRGVVARDDRFAWAWDGDGTGYIVDLESLEVEEDHRLSECFMVSPVVVETVSGYALLGVRSEAGRRDLGVCRLGEDGRVKSVETRVVRPPGYGDDLALSLQAVFPLDP